MYFILDKDMIEDEIVAHLSEQGRGFPPTVPKVENVNAILYKLKLGVHWHLLPVGALFAKAPGLAIGRWAMRGVPSPQKKRKTTNAQYTIHGQGLPLAISEPVSGNHNDLFDIQVQFKVVTATIEGMDIPVEGLFINTDVGFDSKEFHSACTAQESNANVCFNKRNGNTDDRDEYFDKQLYEERYAVERTNTWMDSFCSLLNWFYTTTSSWKGLSYLAFIVIAQKSWLKRKTKKFESLLIQNEPIC